MVPTMKWSIQAEGTLSEARCDSRLMMLSCGTTPIMLLRIISADRTSVATKPAIVPFSAFDMATSQIVRSVLSININPSVTVRLIHFRHKADLHSVAQVQQYYNRLIIVVMLHFKAP